MIRVSNAPFRGRKFDILEGGVRVPLVLRWTGKVAAGQKVVTPASLLDIAATISKAAGAKPSKTDGYDLLNLPANRAVLLKAFYDDPGYAVRRGQWKLYRNHLGVPVQLYNVSTDKGEGQVRLRLHCPEGNEHPIGQLHRRAEEVTYGSGVAWLG